jgi:hypothetical protein
VGGLFAYFDQESSVLLLDVRDMLLFGEIVGFGLYRGHGGSAAAGEAPSLVDEIDRGAAF